MHRFRTVYVLWILHIDWRADSSERGLELDTRSVTSKVTANTAPLLVLWDIDGTLLSSDGSGRSAMAAAFGELFGIPNALDGLELAGRTDQAILLEAVNRFSLPVSTGDLDRFRSRYYTLLRHELASPGRSPRALPGVRHVLETTSRHPCYLTGLLTGNWETSGYSKLSAVGLAHWFSFGAFGGEAPTREDLLPIALSRAATISGMPIPAARAVVIGDTPHDIAVARAHGARSIGVATGIHTVKHLTDAAADRVVTDLTDSAVLEALGTWQQRS